MLVKPVPTSALAPTKRIVGREFSTALSRPSDQLIMSLLERQERMELVQTRFYKFQMAINAFNLAQTNRLSLAQKRLEGQIVAGKAALLALEHSLDKEVERVSELETVVSAAEAELQQVKKELSDLERTIEQQSEQLSRQGNEIKKLSISKSQREALVEALVILASLTAVRSSIVNFPLSTLLTPFPRQSRMTIAAKTLVRLLLFTVLLRKIRSYAILTGWTSEDASLFDYFVQQAFGDLKTAS